MSEQSKNKPTIIPRGVTFYTVMRVYKDNPQGRYYASTRKHPTREEAYDEAKRLAAKHVGSCFAVMAVDSFVYGKAGEEEPHRSDTPRNKPRRAPKVVSDSFSRRDANGRPERKRVLKQSWQKSSR